ncbi:MAG: hypothetical protein ACXW6R_11990 [Candidatus Binatia bacterium]
MICYQKSWCASEHQYGAGNTRDYENNHLLCCFFILEIVLHWGTGMVDEKLQRDMIGLAAQRLKPPPQVAPERVFDFSFARMAEEGLR